jgi:predicted  nucleic acid-binding Zn-ribbon protein
MTTENALWSMNWKFVQSINELTEEIVKLKQRENKLKDERKDLLEEMEELKMKYYVALADLHKERKKDKKMGCFKRRYKVVDLFYFFR